MKKYLPIRTREEAVVYIQQLMDAHWIVRTNKKKVFKDKKIMCMFSVSSKQFEVQNRHPQTKKKNI